MPYYDKIAKQWHQVTGYKGGAFKEYVLNDVLLHKIANINNCSILDLGAGNGYFLPMVLHRFSGQNPSSIVVTDQSLEQLENAKKHFAIRGAQYRPLDVCRPFPFENNCFDIILAIMIFNEITPKGFVNAVQECYRILTNEGIFIIAVTHPDFVSRLQKKGLLQRTIRNILTMPGSGSLRLPIVIRPLEIYQKVIDEAGFDYECEDVFPTQKVLNEKPGLRDNEGIPIALVIKCSKPGKNE
jgi:SAM-dependent methyltransferase